jgi:hypothetical protein
MVTGLHATVLYGDVVEFATTLCTVMEFLKCIFLNEAMKTLRWLHEQRVLELHIRLWIWFKAELNGAFCMFSQPFHVTSMFTATHIPFQLIV